MKSTHKTEGFFSSSDIRVNYIKCILIAVLISSGMACKKNKAAAESPAPTKPNLIAPQSNATCTNGSILSATEAKITLSWTAAENASSYEVKIQNLLTQSTSTHTALASKLEIPLLRNTPYAWSVISKSSNNSSTAESETWKFYVAGEATFSYAPFPADAVSPLNGQSLSASSGKINLDWSASDVDNDIASYDVYLGTSMSNMAVVKGALTESLASEIAVGTGTTYYWKVLTKDSKGNVSWSDVWWFKVGM